MENKENNKNNKHTFAQLFKQTWKTMTETLEDLATSVVLMGGLGFVIGNNIARIHDSTALGVLGGAGAAALVAVVSQVASNTLDRIAPEDIDTLSESFQIPTEEITQYIGKVSRQQNQVTRGQNHKELGAGKVSEDPRKLAAHKYNSKNFGPNFDQDQMK